MKYSIRGTLQLTDETEFINTVNNYTVWKLDPKRSGEEYSFEVWLNTVEDKTELFNDLKPIVDLYGESISWHECTHDEPINQPCVISESYEV